jgi:hypothetical protein
MTNGESMLIVDENLKEAVEAKKKVRRDVWYSF